MAFRGWGPEALEFFEGLEADNSRTYWLANKAVYEESVRAPMQALLEELAPEFGEPRLYRPYRDVRFSADKIPYKTQIAASLDKGGYVSLGANGLGAGSGYYMLMSDQLERYRRAVDEERTGTEIAALVAAARRKGIEVAAHDVLKTIPRGYARDHPRADLLRQKGLVTWKSWPVAKWLGTAAAKDKIREFFCDSRPIQDWLDANVGSTAMEPRQRGR